ncbi:hypothetical protein BXZ70DRAFT_952850 [Cristinia sonorae]|uniref:BTB domain-containing protein n=1 Tax=Cristinia sonorae TaxID=1940300 RepID=A0A8K0XLR2_9AGAR|nr:hypothetical protein BXZ70DRAFT_952850 [Cristinia sonorae]
MTGGSQLHAYFYLRNQHAFHKLLDSSHGQPSSGGRSLNKPSPLSSKSRAEPVDVNARDSLGRTVLHLAASSSDTSAPEYVRMLLAHPAINPNLQDYESHWTALHRALYCGNIASALLLLQRTDVDCNLKDLEGYRAFDLYNSTVHGTKPEASPRTDLFTWGANRNAALGLGDGDDRVYPDQVVIERVPKVAEEDPLDMRFEPVRVKQAVISKLHTAVVTNEPRANVRLCGFGSGGRLGHANHTQYTLLPLPMPHSNSVNLPTGTALSSAISIVALALGQDHTLALTSTGEVYSWGLNRFSQLGYVIDPPSTVAGVRHLQEEASLIQSTPRKVAAPSLKSKFITGIAACRTASVCWSRDEVWTWGTNGGQLGYDKSAQPAQVHPRKVTKVVLPVLQICITETVMACLLESHDVICIFNDATFKINFPTQTFPSSMPTYRPPQAVRNASIKKVTASSGGDGFAALTENGELFLCTLGARDGGQQQSGRDGQVKVQRVWALRKQFSAVKDVEVGVDGSIIICTESGHVFIRSRSANLSTPSSAANLSLLSSTNPSSKAFKFQRVPYMQRAVRVYANSLGAFGALRVDVDPAASGSGHGLEVSGPTIQESLKETRSWLAFGDDFRRRLFLGAAASQDLVSTEQDPDHVLRETEEEEEDEPIMRDISELKKLCEVLERHKLFHSGPSMITTDSIKLFRSHNTSGKWFDPASLPAPSMSAFGADLVIHVKAFRFPAHRLLLSVRSTVLRSVLEGSGPVETMTKEGKIQIKVVPSSVSPRRQISSPPQAPWHTQSHLSISGVHPFTVLILLTYLYTDELLTYWDPRTTAHVLRRLRMIGMDVSPAQVRTELQRLASLLSLHETLIRALEGSIKREIEPRLAKDLVKISQDIQDTHSTVAKSLAPDVVLVLSDIQVSCHSIVLRSRSPFFRAFFDDEDWTRERWTEDGTLVVDLKHLGWRVGRFVVWYLYGGDVDMFEKLEFVRTVDELVEFMFDVMAAANELLLERLVLICSSVILRRVTVSNACSVLAEATHFHAEPLIRQIQRYIAINLETLLESGMLDDLSPDLIKQLSVFIRSEQEIKSPVSRSGQLTKKALENCKDWLELQDIPVPILRTSRTETRGQIKLSPPGPSRKKGTATLASPPSSPAVRPQIEARLPQVSAATSTTEGEVFMMDDSVPSLALDQAQGPLGPPMSATKTAGWKIASTPRVDMKAIMAEAETGKRQPVRPLTSIQPAPRPDPSKPVNATNWRIPPRPEAPVPQRTPSGGSPWRNPPPSHASSSTLQQTPPTTPTMRPVRSKEDVLPGARTTQREPPTPPRAQGMGPVFTPKKTCSPSKPTPSPGFRRVSSGVSGSAWTLPPVQPIVQSSPFEDTPMSFAAIQELQREQDKTPVKDKRSLKEIQEEEQARQVEEDFLKWWAAEEERMRVEQAGVSSSAGPPADRRAKGDKAKGKGKTQQPRKKADQQDGSTSAVTQSGGNQRGEAGGGPQRRRGRGGPPRVERTGSNPSASVKET